MATFLDRLAQHVLDNYSNRIVDTVIVLPSKRAKVFLLEALKGRATQTVFSPEIVSIEEFVSKMSGLRALDNVELLFAFYDTYQKLHKGNPPQKFEYFSNWAVTILQDFNEIDRYLLSSKAILSYLKDIEVLKRWGLEPEQTTTLIANYLQFWDKLPMYYEALYQDLKQEGRGYQGMIYREAVANLERFAQTERKWFVFAGFNALNKAEERIFQHLVKAGSAEILWDIDSYFLSNIHHDAGLFLRRFKNEWPIYRSQPFDWIVDEFGGHKDIEIIGTPKSIGQAKIVGSILEKMSADSGQLQHTAVVLGDENLLLPVLHSLPEQISALNITMGYPAKNNPVQVLVAKLFKLHTGALKRSGTGYVMYYKDVLEILTHPLVVSFAGADNVVYNIRLRNYTFITHQKLYEFLDGQNQLFDLLFKKWDVTNREILETIDQALLFLKARLGRTEDDRIQLAFLFAVYNAIKKLTTYFENHDGESVETLHSLYKQVIDLAEVSFEGEPLTGLQIMGVLESRTLDFDTVIITSLNEGTFPAGKSQNSFIPYDVKREYGLPTFKEKDAIYTYHFYHLLQRAKKVYLLYNTESEGLDGGEKSRFITQLEVEPMPNHVITDEIYNAALPDLAYNPTVIGKTQSVMQRLREIAEKGFSPSSLTTYIRNPIQFYKQRILRISESEDVEENIALNTLGTIIHRTLEELYQPYIGVVLTEDIVNGFAKDVDAVVLDKFREVYKDGDIQKGRNLLAFEVAKRNVSNFLKLERDALCQGDEVVILALEEKFSRELKHPNLPFPVKIAGELDRLELRNGIVRILDYKTGKVEPRNVTLDSWSGFADIRNEKIIQVLAYAYMYEPHLQGRELEVGIISFKNMKDGFMPFTYKPAGTKETVQLVTQQIREDYLEQLVNLLQEILDPEVPFSEPV